MSRRPLIAGNWKMNGTREQAAELAAGISAAGKDSVAEMLVCPPYPYLGLVADALAGSTVALGAQNVSDQANGAFTGEISATMLSDVGCTYVIVGHSERRQFYGEDSELVAKKARVAATAGMRPIICVGEMLNERENGLTEQVIDEQLSAVFAYPGEDYGELVIAYEPVWAIGTGKTASPQQAQDVHAFIRGKLSAWNAELGAKTRILYGGSVKPDNAGELLSMSDVDGGLVGGASLQAESFVAIANAL